MTKEQIAALRPGDRVGRKGGYRRKGDVWTIREIHRVETTTETYLNFVRCPSVHHPGEIVDFSAERLKTEVEWIDREEL